MRPLLHTQPTRFGLCHRRSSEEACTELNKLLLTKVSVRDRNVQVKMLVVSCENVLIIIINQPTNMFHEIKSKFIVKIHDTRSMH